MTAKSGLFWETAKRPKNYAQPIKKGWPVNWGDLPVVSHGYRQAEKSDVAEWKKSQQYIYCKLVEDKVLFTTLRDINYLLLELDDSRIAWLFDNCQIVGFNLNQTLKGIVKCTRYLDLCSISKKSYTSLCASYYVAPYTPTPACPVDRYIEELIKRDTYIANVVMDEYREEIDRRASLHCGEDVMSISFSTIAERLFLAKYQETSGTLPKKSPIVTSCKPFIPTMDFRSDSLTQLVYDVTAIEFDVTKEGMKKVNPIFDDLVKIGRHKYSWGKGGLHSTQKNISYYSDADHSLVVLDVFSNYPSLIIEQGIFPKGQDHFLEVYQHFYDQRLTANGHEKRTLKDILNVIYGKFNSEFSPFYSPDNMLRVTLTMQLYLMMLIDWLENDDIEVISANTDGVIVYISNDQREKLDHIVYIWRYFTNFGVTEDRLKSIHFKDVLNYISVSDRIDIKGSIFKKEPEVSLHATKTLICGQNIDWHDFPWFIFRVPLSHSRPIMHQNTKTARFMGNHFFAYHGTDEADFYNALTLESVDKFNGYHLREDDKQINIEQYQSRVNLIAKSLGLSID